MADPTATTVYLVQQGVWDMPLESMPLASGYLKAAALADEHVAQHTDIQIFSFRGRTSLIAMATALFQNRVPDVLACSVLGWNYRAFGSLAETFKQLNPDGWVILGGTHVANQGARVFGAFPDVDVVVDGEGEEVFRDLLRAYLDGASPRALDAIDGISFHNGDGVVTTPPRERINDLDVIPSPTLTGAIELTDSAGRFRYDVALMETNRGCPYKCSFCYWGGSVGQRVRAFSRERLRQELELFARLQVHTVVLCDANFGLLPIDAEFVDDLIATRDRYGFPQALETSWAKNKSKVFFDIVRTMARAGMRSSFTLALQTLSDDALTAMNRRNMKVNEWEDLAEWLNREGLDCYAELIWGAPGETIESFTEGYDRLANYVSRIAVYPLLLLPNTEYADKKQQYGIVSVRGDDDDFQYVLAHNTMTFAENQQMQRFMFWARVMAENAVLRHVWLALRVLGDITQSQGLRNISAWMQDSDDPAAPPLRAVLARSIAAPSELGAALGYLYGDPEAKRLLARWWAESIHPLVPDAVAGVLDEVFRYDVISQPIYHDPGAAGPPEELPVVEMRGEQYFVRRDVDFAYDVPAILAALRAKTEPDLAPNPVRLDLYYQVGAETTVTSTNHETIMHYMARSADEVMADSPAGPNQPATALLADRGGCT
jgi:radical SAM superfamily enzyme YgiQ (UPF0313 family)